MKKNLINSLILVSLVGFVACASPGQKPKMNFYHGATVPDLYISVISHTPEVIVFEIKAQFLGKHLYHLVLDGNEPLSEGWFPTSKVPSEAYTVKMKAKKGCLFQPGKEYRLCIGGENPEYVHLTSSNYPCIIDYEFVLD